MTLDTESLYRILYKHMGPQGWWPADSKNRNHFGSDFSSKYELAKRSLCH